MEIREFIYLNVDKINSILSQIEEGLSLETTESHEDGEKVGGKMSVGKIIEYFLKSELDAEISSSDKKGERKILHDYVYNYLESKLIEENKIIRIENSNETALPKNITTDSYVLLKGKIKLEDYNHILNIIENFNNLTIALGIVTSGLSFSDLDNQWNEYEAEMRKDLKLFNDAYIESLSLLINQFYNNRLLVKCMPFKKNLFMNFVGLLNKDFLKEDIGDILFKYGSSPSMDWWVFGKISDIPPKDDDSLQSIEDLKYKRIQNNQAKISPIIDEADEYEELSFESRKIWKSINLDEDDFKILKNKNLELAFENIFELFGNVEFETNIKYPSVKFTPIAIYRT